jgi:hypothetical protein
VVGATRTASDPGSTDATDPESTSQVTIALDGREPPSSRDNSSPTRILQSSGRMVRLPFWVVMGLEAGIIEITRKRTMMRAKLRSINGILERCDDFADRTNCQPAGYTLYVVRPYRKEISLFADWKGQKKEIE